MVSAITCTLEVAVHPLEGLVVLTVYVPPAFTIGEAVPPLETIFPPLLAVQLYVAPEVVEEPFN